MSTKSRRRGKDLERWVAKYFGGRRVGILGQEDVRLNWGCSVEAKERKKLPTFIYKAMAQAERNAGGDMAWVVLHQLGDEYENGLVIMRCKDAKAILKKEAT